MAAITASAHRFEASSAFTAAFSALGKDGVVFLALALPLIGAPALLARVIETSPLVLSVMRSSRASAILLGYVIELLVMVAPRSLFAGVVIERVVTALQGRPAPFGRCLSVGLGRAPVLMVALLFHDLAVGLGFLALVVPGVFMSVAWAVVAPVVVIERGSVPSCFSRSADLTRGSRGAVLGFSVAVGLVSIVLAAVAGLGIGAVFRALQSILPPITIAGRGAGVMLVSPVAGAITSTIYMSASAALYCALQRDREGIDRTAVAAVFD